MRSRTALLQQSWNDWITNELDPVGPVWLPWLWSAVFALGLGLCITLIGFAQHARGADWTSLANWRHWLSVNLFISFFVTAAVHSLYALTVASLGKARIRRWPDRRRHLLFGLVTLVAVALAWPVAVSLSGYELSLWDNPTRAGQVGLGSLLAVLLMSVLFNLHAANRAHRLAAERREAEARLQLLQAQIEPHFLFNSLAHVLSLIEVDPPQARALLEHFVDYLRASLGGLRQPSHTLGDELHLVRAYLQVQGHRMGDRLSVHWDVPDNLLALPLPALLLQPLVENALQHGLEPAVDGGSLWISARQQGHRWQLSVRDDGLGLGEQRATRGHGSALANIRSRLQHLPGGRGELSLVRVAPHGTLCRLDLPVRPDTPRP